MCSDAPKCTFCEYRVSERWSRPQGMIKVITLTLYIIVAWLFDAQLITRVGDRPKDPVALLSNSFAWRALKGI